MLFVEGFQGEFRELFLLLNTVQLFACGEIATLFFYRGTKKSQYRPVNFGWGTIFAFLAILQVTTIVTFFYLSPEAYQETAGIFRVSRIIPVLGIVGLLEHFYQRYQKTRYGIFFGGLIISAIYFFKPSSSIVFGIVLLYFGVLLIFSLVFFRKFLSLSAGSIRSNLIIFTIAFYILMGGNFLTSTETTETMRSVDGVLLIIGLLGRILQITSYFIMGAILGHIPIFFEVNWPENVVELHVIHKIHGLPLLTYDFTPTSDEGSRENLAGELVAGGMIGITTMLKEISGSREDVKVIDHGDLKILLEPGESVLLALLVKEDMKILREKLSHLRDTIQRLFGNILQDWDGNLKYFDPLNEIIRKEFTQEESGKKIEKSLQKPKDFEVS